MENVNNTIRTLLHSYTVGQFNELYLADKDFKAYAQKVYHYFDTMQPGAKLNLLAYEGKRLEWLLLTYVAFYFEGAHWLEYEISDDYCTIVRRDVPPDVLQREIAHWLKWKREHHK